MLTTGEPGVPGGAGGAAAPGRRASAAAAAIQVGIGRPPVHVGGRPRGWAGPDAFVTSTGAAGRRAAPTRGPRCSPVIWEGRCGRSGLALVDRLIDKAVG